MVLAVGLALGLGGWSLVANLVLGDAAYVVRNLALGVLLLGLAMRSGLAPASLGLARDTVGRGLRWGAATAAVVAVAVALAVVLADQLRPVALLLADERADLSPQQLTYHALVRIPLGTAVFEEVAFRGVLLAALLRIGLRLWAAVGWSSLVFGLWHVAPTIVALRVNEVAVASPTGLGTVAGAVAVTTVAGVAFCALRLGARSLLAPMLAHWATNSLGLVAAALTETDHR